MGTGSVPYCPTFLKKPSCVEFFWQRMINDQPSLLLSFKVARHFTSMMLRWRNTICFWSLIKITFLSGSFFAQSVRIKLALPQAAGLSIFWEESLWRCTSEKDLIEPWGRTADRIEKRRKKPGTQCDSNPWPLCLLLCYSRRPFYQDVRHIFLFHTFLLLYYGIDGRLEMEMVIFLHARDG